MHIWRRFLCKATPTTQERPWSHSGRHRAVDPRSPGNNPAASHPGGMPEISRWRQPPEPAPAPEPPRRGGGAGLRGIAPDALRGFQRPCRGSGVFFDASPVAGATEEAEGNSGVGGRASRLISECPSGTPRGLRCWKRIIPVATPQRGGQDAGHAPVAFFL